VSPSTSIATPGVRQATAREFLAVVFRRRWIILGLFAATTATVLAVTLSRKAEYISSGRVLVKRGEQESVMTPTRRLMGAWEEDLGSEVQLVKSQPVVAEANRLLRAEAAAGEAAPSLNGGQIDVEVMGKSTVLAIGYVDGDSSTARRACDALIRAYLRFRQRDLSLAYPKAFFDEEIGRVQGELEHWVEMRRQFTNREEVVDLTEQRRMMINRLASLETTRSSIEADLAESRSVHRQLESMLAGSATEPPSFIQFDSNDHPLTEMKKRVLEQETRVASLRERFRDESPEVVSALATLATVRAMLEREMDARLELAAAKVQTQAARLAVYDRDIAELRAELELMPDRETRLSNMDRRITLLRKRLEDMTEKSDQALVNERTSLSSSVFLVAPAGAAVPTRTLDLVRLLLAPAFSLVVGIGLAFFIDGLDLTVRTPGHAEETVELPVLAAINERRRVGTR
jgi:uncharacterized protein involved in exopolysaccharide biosynthesis